MKNNAHCIALTAMEFANAMAHMGSIIAARALDRPKIRGEDNHIPALRL